MPGIVSSRFDVEYDRERLALTAIAKRLVKKRPAAFRAAGKAIDTGFTVVAERKLLKIAISNNAKARDSNPEVPLGRQQVPPKTAGLFSVPVWIPQPNAGDSLRGARLSRAISEFSASNTAGALTRALGNNLPRAERKNNARRALLLALAAIDPDATEDLSSYTDLAKAPWTAPVSVTKPVVDRSAVCHLWGHECVALLREGIQVLAPEEQLPPSTAELRNERAREQMKASMERLNQRDAENQRKQDLAERAAQLARPLSISDAIDQLRAMSQLQGKQFAPTYEAAGLIVLKMARLGALTTEVKGRSFVLAHDALPNGPRLLPVWLDFVSAMRTRLGLDSKDLFAGFADDVRLTADMLERELAVADSAANCPKQQGVRRGRDEVMALLETTTPALNKQNGQWVKNGVAAGLESLETRSLAAYRAKGVRNQDLTLGRDESGRVWRRSGSPNSHPWYLKASLTCQRKP
jgi:hypothetical protein